MRIGTPTITRRQGRHVLSAQIATETSGVNCPESLWFSTDCEDSPFQPDMADAFVVGLIASAMYLGEDIRVDGMVSTRLAHGLDTYQDILNTWWPDTFKCVDVHYENLSDRRQDLRPAGVACTFSGGVDSFHTVLQLLPSNMKYRDFSISHALMINGFDQLVDLERRGLAQAAFNTYQAALDQWDVTLLMVDTNVGTFRKSILGRREMALSYSGPLAASAHALGAKFGRFGISGHGTYAYADLLPYGSHPALDHHLSSDQLQIVHAGTSHSRAKKIEMLADIPHVQENLMVCAKTPVFDQQTGLPVNCCECEKCVRTMVVLTIIGKLDNFPTFSKRRPPLTTYQNPNLLSAIPEDFLADMVDLAHRHDQKDWGEVLETALDRRLALKRKAQKT
ncbi:MAG: hypothetical protein WBM36_06265 [Lysobacterales bacterium]